MDKVRHIDFNIKASNNERVIFRFYPRQSNCHSYNEEPPKNWDQVYKVYYSYAVIHKEIWEEKTYTRTVFDMKCDECSALTSLADAIRWMIENDEEKVEQLSVGQPGSEWSVEKRWSDEYLFMVWENIYNNGYKFCLTKQRTLDFAEYLDTVNDYMVTHGDPI